MQTYTTIVGVIELRMQKVGYATTQKRYEDACLARITDKRRSYRLEMNGISMRESVK